MRGGGRRKGGERVRRGRREEAKRARIMKLCRMGQKEKAASCNLQLAKFPRNCGARPSLGDLPFFSLPLRTRSMIIYGGLRNTP